MGLPRANIYLPGLDLTFRWGRGDGFMVVRAGMHPLNDSESNLVERVAVDQRGWTDNQDLYKAIDRYVRERHPEWHRVHGPISPSPNAV